MTAVAPRSTVPPAEGGRPPLRQVAEGPRGRSTAWWGMVLFITTEGTFGATLLASHFYVRFTTRGPWPPHGIAKPELLEPAVETALLLASVAPMLAAVAAVRRGNARRALALLPLVALLGAAFLAVQGHEWSRELDSFTWTTNAYGSFFYVIEGFDIFHVSTGLVMLCLVFAVLRAGRAGYLLQDRVRIVAFYWYFVVVLWLAILFTLYLSPRI